MSKSKTALIIFLVIAVVAVIVISVVNKPGDTSQTTGTIGKTEKYRKTQMTEKDVMLRSEFVSDTSLIAQTIQGLLYFNAFAADYASGIDSWVTTLEKNEFSPERRKALEEYSLYLKQGSQTIQGTIILLNDFYKGDTTELSIDVEGQLKEFDAFVAGIIQRDSIVTKTIPELNDYIQKADLKDEQLKAKITDLVNIHDIMLIRNFQLACVLGRSDLASHLLGMDVLNAINVSALIPVGVIVANTVQSNEELSSIIMNNEKLSCFNREKLNALFCGNTAGINNTPMGNTDLSSIVLAKDKLGYFLNNDFLQVVEIQASQKLNLYTNTQSLGTIYSNTQSLNLVYGSAQTLGRNSYQAINSYGSIILGNRVLSAQALDFYVKNRIDAVLLGRLDSDLMNRTLNSY